MLVSDAGFNGLIIRTNRLNVNMNRSPETGLVMTGSSVPISSFLRRACQEGWGGLEFLTGIPGYVGGAVIMNGGTHLGETSSRLKEVEWLRLGVSISSELEKISENQFKYAYRKNSFVPADAIIYSATLQVDNAEPAEVKKVIDETLVRRKATQPLDYPSCGSVFKNPREHGLLAWQVIEKLALKGHRIGDAQIAEKHSNWIINLDSARASDVWALIELIKRRAKIELGIEMEEEVKWLGEKPEV